MRNFLVYLFKFMIELTTTLLILLGAMHGGAAIDAADILEKTALAKEGNATIEYIEPQTLEAYVRSYYKDTPILAEISKCESRFRQYDRKGNVIRGLENSKDVGLMQINEHYHLETAKKLGYDLKTIDGNLAYAKHLYGEEGVDPWSASAKCWSKAVPKEIAKK
jgi:hypothetical protein